MDNLGKALYMAAGVLLFIVALTASVFLYNKIIENANIALVVSDMGERAESVSTEGIDHTRKIMRSEIIGSIIEMDSLQINKIIVDNGNSKLTYEPYKQGGEIIKGYMVGPHGKVEEINEYRSFDTDIAKGTYSVKYKYNSNSKLIDTIEYKYIGGV